MSVRNKIFLGVAVVPVIPVLIGLSFLYWIKKHITETTKTTENAESKTP